MNEQKTPIQPPSDEVVEKNRQTQNRMREALDHAQATWEAAQAAIDVALQAAEAAHQLCRDARNQWKRSDGPEICELSEKGSDMALDARSRAHDASISGVIADRNFTRKRAAEPRLGPLDDPQPSGEPIRRQARP